MMRALRLLITIGLVGSLLAISAVSVAATGGRPLGATLTGAAEAPGPGDPDGSGSVWITVNPGQQEVCYALSVSGITPAVAAHIHIGDVGVPGPIVVPLVAPADGSSMGCADVTRELAMALIKDPSSYYDNDHPADFPGGAVRGQLSK
jgi:hypothetical protein